MKIRISLYLTLIILANVQISCAQSKETGFDIMLNGLLSNSVDQISSEELKSKIESKSIILLDSREIQEYETSHIDGARFVGYENFNKSEVKDISKESEVIVYCSVGYRSEKIGEKLKKMGYENVYNLRGGIFDWKNSGFNVVDNNGQFTEKIHTYNKEWSRWLFNGEKVYD